MKDFNDMGDSFVRENDELIESIEDNDTRNFLGEMHARYTKEPRDNNNIFQYAEIQLGLAKCLDFLLPRDMLLNSKVQNAMINVINLAYQIFQYRINYCSNKSHEDGACLVGGLNYARRNNGANTFSTWPELPMIYALNFTGKITPEMLAINTTIYRVIGDDEARKKGFWWLEAKPKNLKSWRSDFAVSKQWNAGTKCAQVKLKKEIYAWKGLAATQAVPNSGVRCYLPGGGYQIWLDPDEIEDEINVASSSLR